MAPDPPHTPPDRWSGRTSGEFLVKHPLGSGGFGMVYLAEQVAIGRDVVVKVIRRALTDEPKVAERFRREARVAARISHPNIVEVITAGDCGDDELYLAMEYVPGPTLADVIATDGRLPAWRALHIVEQIAAALAAAHAAGVVHRDLKPANVILADIPGRVDHVKVLDFGIAKSLDGETEGRSALTASGAIIGTPAYMSPEQVSGKLVDGRSDIYTLGVMLYEMVTGAHPYEATTPVEYIIHHLQDPITPASERVPGVTVAPEVEQIILRCTAKSPEDRFHDAEALRQAVRHALQTSTVDSATIPRVRPPTAQAPPPNPGTRIAAVVAGALFVAVLMGAATLWFVVRSGDAPAPTPTEPAAPAARSAAAPPSTAPGHRPKPDVGDTVRRLPPSVDPGTPGTAGQIAIVPSRTRAPRRSIANDTTGAAT